MRELGLHVDADGIIGMKVQGITPEYVREMRAATGETLDADDLVGMKVQGITPEYVKEIHEMGLKADSGDLIGLKVQGSHTGICSGNAEDRSETGCAAS